VLCLVDLGADLLQFPTVPTRPEHDVHASHYRNCSTV